MKVIDGWEFVNEDGALVAYWVANGKVRAELAGNGESVQVVDGAILEGGEVDGAYELSFAVIDELRRQGEQPTTPARVAELEASNRHLSAKASRLEAAAARAEIAITRDSETHAFSADDIWALLDELEGLRALINTPRIDNFLEAVRLEAAHQVERWGSEHDEGKGPTDWFWLLGYLGGKAVWAATHGDRDKALHHVITTAAACLNWHAQLSGNPRGMRPGIEPPKESA